MDNNLMTVEQFREVLGKTILSLRKERGLTQLEFGDMVSRTMQTVRGWEDGLTTPDAFAIYTIAKTLGISADDLLDVDIQERNNNDFNSNIVLFTKLQSLPEKSIKYIDTVIDHEIELQIISSDYPDWIASNTK